MPAGRGATRFSHKKKTRQKLAAAVALGHRGGLKGGPARASVLSKERRVNIARMGGQARYRGT